MFNSACNKKDNREIIIKTLKTIKEHLKCCVNKSEAYHLRNSLDAIYILNKQEIIYKRNYRLVVFWDIGLEEGEDYENVVASIGLPEEVSIDEGIIHEEVLSSTIAHSRIKQHLEDKYGFKVEAFYEINEKEI